MHGDAQASKLALQKWQLRCRTQSYVSLVGLVATPQGGAALRYALFIPSWWSTIMWTIRALFLVLMLGPVYAHGLLSSASVAEADCRIAREFLKQGKYGEARKAAEDALHSDPQSPEAAALAGEAELGLGHLKAAQKHLERAVALQPSLNKSDPRLLLALLDAYIRLNEERQASATLASLDRCLVKEPDQRMQIAALLVKESAYDLAAEEFERLRAANPDSYELNYDLALAYYRAGKETQASEVLRNLVARKDDAELEDLLGDVEERSKNHTGATAAFRRAVQLAPGNETYRFDYAQCLEAQWNLAAAAKVFQAGALDFPSSAKMWLGLGATYYLAGRYKEAAQTLLQAARVAPNAPQVYRLLGLAYEAAGPFQEAIADRFSHYLISNPPDAMAHYYYGKILIERSRQGQTEGPVEAQRQLQEAINLSPNLAEAHTELGVLLRIQGQLDDASRELERAVQLDPESSAAYYELARVYKKLGESDHAQEAIQKFQRLKATQNKNLDRDAVRRILSRANGS